MTESNGLKLVTSRSLPHASQDSWIGSSLAGSLTPDGYGGKFIDLAPSRPRFPEGEVQPMGRSKAYYRHRFLEVARPDVL
ncbi:MAG: hypothetical protein P8M04_00655 [Akkermansiaceae bacterium]|nr:hypothetical protein [Akkermansiaceae bacterium]